MEKRLGFIGILIENREDSANGVNALLSSYANSIIVRTGVPYREKDVSVISLVVDMDSDEMGSITGKLGQINGVSVKSGLSKR